MQREECGAEIVRSASDLLPFPSALCTLAPSGRRANLAALSCRRARAALTSSPMQEGRNEQTDAVKILA